MMQQQRPHRPPVPEPPKKPLTYGEYRKMREEAQRRHMHPNQSLNQPPQQNQPVLNRRDPRRQPKPVSEQPKPSQQEPQPVPEKAEKQSSSSGQSLGKFKIPKKKKEPVKEPSFEQVEEAFKKGAEKPKVEKPKVEKPKVEEPKVEEPKVVESNDESDSEPELKIAESDHEEDNKKEELKEKEPKKEEVESEKKSETSKEEDKTGQLTKAMLQNIVASIDTKEASKLLERATRLLNSEDGNHKLSLKQLLVGDSDSEEEEKPTETKKSEAKITTVKKKGRPAASASTTTSKAPKVTTVKKPAKQPTPGTRRSRRLQVAEEEPEPEVKTDEPEAMEEKPADHDDTNDDDDEDDNQLVIDETPNDADTSMEIEAPKKTRGRPKKDTSIVKEEQKEEHKEEQKEDIKEEPKEDLDDILKPKTRMQKSRMTGPKSKTWFPNASERGLNKAKNVESVIKSPTRTEIKREPKDPDMKVFAVSENVTILESFLDDSVKAKASNVSLHFRNESLSSFFGKLKNSEDETPGKDGISPDKSKKGDLKKSDPVQDDLKMSLEQPLPEIIIAQNQDESIIDASKLSDTTAKSDECETSDILDFIDVVKKLKPSDQDVLENFKELSKSEQKGMNLIKTDPVQAHKDLQSVQEILSDPAKLQHLFKCMSHTCPFTCDSAQEFKNHLQDTHANDKRKNRHGWLKCAYCLRKLANQESLVNHVIRDHGQFEHFQCPYCFYRHRSQWSLLMHLQNAHPGSDPVCLNSTCLGDDEIEAKLPPISASFSKGLFCQSCPKDVGKKFRNAQELSDHLYLDHGKPDPYQDFQCPHCLNHFESCARLIFHLRLSHGKKPTSVLFREIKPSLNIDDLSENEDSDHEEERAKESPEETVKVEESHDGKIFRFTLF